MLRGRTASVTAASPPCPRFSPGVLPLSRAQWRAGVLPTPTGVPRVGLGPCFREEEPAGHTRSAPRWPGWGSVLRSLRERHLPAPIPGLGALQGSHRVAAHVAGAGGPAPALELIWGWGLCLVLLPYSFVQPRRGQQRPGDGLVLRLVTHSHITHFVAHVVQRGPLGAVPVASVSLGPAPPFWSRGSVSSCADTPGCSRPIVWASCPGWDRPGALVLSVGGGVRGRVPGGLCLWPLGCHSDPSQPTARVCNCCRGVPRCLYCTRRGSQGDPGSTQAAPLASL